MIEILSAVRSVESDRKTYCLEENMYRTVHTSIALAAFIKSQHTEHETVSLRLILPTEEIDRGLLRVEAKRTGVDDIEFIFCSKSRDQAGAVLDRIRGEKPSISRWIDFSDCEGFLSILLTVFAVKICQDRDVIVRLFEGKRQSINRAYVNFVEHTSLLRVATWGCAIRTLEEHFENGPITDILHQIHDQSYKEPSEVCSEQLQRLGNIFDTGFRAARSALPMEAGQPGPIQNKEDFWEEVRDDFHALMPELADRVSDLRNRIDLLLNPVEREKKTQLPLTEDELKRQLRIVNLLRTSGHVLPAYLLVRELLVNGAILGSSHHVSGDKWMDPEVREQYTTPLYHLNYWNRDDELRKELGEDQRKLARVWQSVKRRRNDLAHAGFMAERVWLPRLEGRLEKLVPEIRELVMEHRGLLSNPITFPYKRVSLLLPYHPAHSPEIDQLFLTELEDITTLFMLCKKREDIDDEGSLEVVLEDQELEVKMKYLPDGVGTFECWTSIWEEHRFDLLKSSRVDVVVSGGTGPARYACRKIYNEIRQYGIHVRKIHRVDNSTAKAGEEVGKGFTTLEEYRPPGIEHYE